MSPSSRSESDNSSSSNLKSLSSSSSISLLYNKKRACALFLFFNLAGPVGHKQCAVVAYATGHWRTWLSSHRRETSLAIERKRSSQPNFIIKKEIRTDSFLFFNLAGPVGLEPTNDGTKTRCLTTWRRPNINTIISHFKISA